MTEKESPLSPSFFKPPKSPLECLNMHIPSLDNSDIQKDGISDDEEVTDVFMHIYSEEGREFTSYTTFHGMIRIFNSSTWTSVIFWCLLVLTCVVFYIYYSGSILNRYFQKHTYQEINYLTFNTNEFSYPYVFICPSLPYSFKTLKDNNLTEEAIDYLNSLSWRQSEFDFEKFKIIDNKNWTFDNFRLFQKGSTKTCYETILRSSYGRREINVCADSRQVETINGYCLLINFSKAIINAKTHKAVRLILKNHDVGGYRIYVQTMSQQLLTSDFFHLMPNRKMSLHASLRNSSFSTPENGGNCISNWTQTTFTKIFNLNIQLPYSMKVCEHLRFSKVVFEKQGCIPSHMKHIIKNKYEACKFFNDSLLLYPDQVLKDKCYLECEKKEFIISKFGHHPMKLWNGIINDKNISLLEMSFASRIYQKRSQVKLLQTVDVLSRIGGNTSLFFGFSCVTLMETFIFLFKSVVQLFAYQPPPEDQQQQQQHEQPRPSTPKLSTVIYSKKLKRKSTISISMYHGKLSIVENSYNNKPDEADVLNKKQRKRPVSLCPLDDAISEKDEADSLIAVTPKRKSMFAHPDETAAANNRRRNFAARERFRSSIYTLIHEQSQRVQEPCYGFRPSIDSTSFSGPLQTNNRSSVISIGGQHRTSNPRVRIIMEDSPRRPPSILMRYNSGLGNF